MVTAVEVLGSLVGPLVHLCGPAVSGLELSLLGAEGNVI